MVKKERIFRVQWYYKTWFMLSVCIEQFLNTTEWLQHFLTGYTVVLTFTKRTFQICFWINSVLYSGYRNERQKNFNCNFFCSCFSATSNCTSLGFTVILYKRNPNLKNDRLCLDWVLQPVTGLISFPLPKKVTSRRSCILVKLHHRYRRLPDYWAIYQGIDLTRNKIWINVINDVVADRFLTLEQNHDLHMHRNSVPKKHKTRISLVKPKEPIKMLEVC